jgi:hypothetical protein
MLRLMSEICRAAKSATESRDSMRQKFSGSETPSMEAVTAEEPEEEEEEEVEEEGGALSSDLHEKRGRERERAMSHRGRVSGTSCVPLRRLCVTAASIQVESYSIYIISGSNVRTR